MNGQKKPLYINQIWSKTRALEWKWFPAVFAAHVMMISVEIRIGWHK